MKKLFAVLFTIMAFMAAVVSCSPSIEDDVLPIEKEMTTGGDDGVIHSDEGEATQDPLPPPPSL